MGNQTTARQTPWWIRLADGFQRVTSMQHFGDYPQTCVIYIDKEFLFVRRIMLPMRLRKGKSTTSKNLMSCLAKLYFVAMSRHFMTERSRVRQQRRCATNHESDLPILFELRRFRIIYSRPPMRACLQLGVNRTWDFQHLSIGNCE